MKQIPKNVPDGTRDLIYEEVLAQRCLRQEIETLFSQLGYSPVVTPTLEFYDIFDHDRRAIQETSIYKFTGPDGRLLALRPDNTAPIARLVSTKLREANLPLTLCYSQTIFRLSAAYNAKRSEILQCGVEILGGDKRDGDLRALFTALETLKLSGESFKLEIGHAGFFEALIRDEDLSEEQKAHLRSYIAAKHSGGYDFCLGQTSPRAVELARLLPRLCGGREVLEKAYRLAQGNAAACAILDELAWLYDAFWQAGLGDKIMIDLGIVQSIDYYTGLVFRGYVEGIGEAVLSGGRYDRLLEQFGKSMPACGFAVNVSELAVIRPVQAASSAAEWSFSAGAEDLKRAMARLQKARETHD